MQMALKNLKCEKRQAGFWCVIIPCHPVLTLNPPKMLEKPHGMPIQDPRQGSDQVGVEDAVGVRVPLVKWPSHGSFSHFRFLSAICIELDGSP